jgi:nucleotidyltransferase substrate binding protein (TIGR01987 family)
MLDFWHLKLMWKTLKKILAKNGLEVNSPRETFREAGRSRVIARVEPWMEFVKMRNLTVHTYNEETVDIIFGAMPEFRAELDSLIENIQRMK